MLITAFGEPPDPMGAMPTVNGGRTPSMRRGPRKLARLPTRFSTEQAWAASIHISKGPGVSITTVGAPPALRTLGRTGRRRNAR
jgi:hypothetical protein